MADIVPLPLARRKALILRQGAWFAEQSPHAAEINLQRQIQVQRDALTRRGVAPDVVARECRELESAIRAVVENAGGASNG